MKTCKTCKSCKFFEKAIFPEKFGFGSCCSSAFRIYEPPSKPDQLVLSDAYCDSIAVHSLLVGPEFGCVHHEENKP